MKTTIRTATACMLLTGLLGTAGAQDNINRLVEIGQPMPADQKPADGAPGARELTDVEITEEAAQSILNQGEAKTAFDKLKAAISLKSLEEAGKYLDRASMETIDEWIDFKKEKIVVFAWQGSGQDSFRASPSNSTKEQAEFSYTPGRTKDLKTHVQIYALPKDTRWSVIAAERIQFKCGNDIDGQLNVDFDAPPGTQLKIDMTINGQPVPVQPQAPEE